MMKICSRCVMDTSIKDITFTSNGYCNYCNDFFKRYSFQKNSNIEEIKLEKLNHWFCSFVLEALLCVDCFLLHSSLQIMAVPTQSKIPFSLNEH